MACDTAQSTHRKQVPGRGGWDGGMEGWRAGCRDGGMESGMQGWRDGERDGGMEGWRAGCRDGGMQGRDALDGRQQARLTQDPQEHGREESATS